MAINVKPLGNRVLVQPLEEKEVKKEASSFPTRRKRSLRKVAAVGTDPYGHPEGANLTTFMPGIYDHVVAARHCDIYGHVEGNVPRPKGADEAVVVN